MQKIFTNILIDAETSSKILHNQWFSFEVTKKQVETIPKMASPTKKENFIYLKKRTSKYCQNETSGHSQKLCPKITKTTSFTDAKK